MHMLPMEKYVQVLESHNWVCHKCVAAFAGKPREAMCEKKGPSGHKVDKADKSCHEFCVFMKTISDTE